MRAIIREFIVESKCDFMLAEYGTQAIPVVELAKELNIPLFGYLRGFDASSALRSVPTLLEYRHNIPTLAGLFSVSRFLLENLERHKIKLPPETHVIPSGVDTQAFTSDVKVEHSYLAVGRLVAKKDPLTTIRAFLEATQTTPEARLTVVGDGPLMNDCKDLLLRKDVEGKVNMLGAASHQCVRELLKKTAVFLQHSITDSHGNTEGLPTAIQEAMAAGCAIVTTRHAGIPEAIMHERNGLLVEEGDFWGYVKSIEKMQDSTIRHALMLQARADATERFDNHIGLKVLEGHIKRIVGGVRTK